MTPQMPDPRCRRPAAADVDETPAAEQLWRAPHWRYTPALTRAEAGAMLGAILAAHALLGAAALALLP